jgi:hypothetical protein
LNGGAPELPITIVEGEEEEATIVHRLPVTAVA